MSLSKECMNRGRVQNTGRCLPWLQFRRAIKNRSSEKNNVSELIEWTQNKFHAIGLVERFDDSFKKFKVVLGGADVFGAYERIGKTPALCVLFRWSPPSHFSSPLPLSLRVLHTVCNPARCMTASPDMLLGSSLSTIAMMYKKVTTGAFLTYICIYIYIYIYPVVQSGHTHCQHASYFCTKKSRLAIL